MDCIARSVPARGLPEARLQFGPQGRHDREVRVPSAIGSTVRSGGPPADSPEAAAADALEDPVAAAEQAPAAGEAPER